MFVKFLSFGYLLCFVLVSTEQQKTENLPEVVWTGASIQAGFISKLDTNEQNINDTHPVKIYTDVNGGLGALAIDAVDQRIFFQNSKREFLGIRNLATNTTEKYFYGMMKNVAEMAFDWLSGNLYYTDFFFKYVMVVDPTFTYYYPVYQTKGGLQPQGVAVHPTERTMYISMRQYNNHRIVRTDLDGENAETILKYPTISSVHGITVDYALNRLYWVDYNYTSASIKSSDLNGSNIIVHIRDRRAVFKGIASFQGLLYATDQQYYFDKNRIAKGEVSNFYYKMWMQESEGQTSQHILNDLPVKVTYMMKNRKAIASSYVSPIGACAYSNLTKCDHICLPKKNEKRKCSCSVGYTKVGETGCKADFLGDHFLLVFDQAQQKVFQIPITSAKNGSYTIAPIPAGFERMVVTMAMNVKTKTLYWSDKNTSTIYQLRMFRDSSTVAIKRGMHARAMAIDPITGNVYFADEDTGYIYIMNADGEHVKTIMIPNSSSGSNSFIIDMEIDLQNGYVYWVEVANRYGSIRRMKMNGENQELVIDRLRSITSINIDHQSQTFSFNQHNVIYEIPLSSIVIGNRRKIFSSAKRKAIRMIAGSQPYIIDFIKDGNTTFFTAQGHYVVRDFQSDEYTNLFRQFGTMYFYQPTKLLTYRSSYYIDYIAPLGNPCNNNPCSQLCIILSPTNRTCACDDKSGTNGNQCSPANQDSTDLPPDYHQSCPGDSQVNIRPCENSTRLSITPPQWSDDKTATKNLKLTSPIIQSSYTPGTYDFEYTATDSAGHIGRCLFTITVTESQSCSYEFQSYNGVTMEPPRCDGDTYVHYYKCENPNQAIMFNGETKRSVRNICFPGRYWSIPDISLLTCVDSPIPILDVNKTAVDEINATTLSQLVETPLGLKNSNNNDGGLSVGSTVAISIVAVLAVLGLFIVVLFMGRGKWARVLNHKTTGFRLFWKSADEMSLTKDVDAQSMQSIS